MLSQIHPSAGVIAAAVQTQHQMGVLPVFAERVIGRRGMVRMVVKPADRNAIEAALRQLSFNRGMTLRRPPRDLPPPSQFLYRSR